MIEAMKQALEALNETVKFFDGVDLDDSFNPPTAKWAHNVRADALWSITSLRQAIEQAEKQAPVATLIEHLAFTDGIIRFYGVENMEQLPVGTEFYTTPQPQQDKKQEPVTILQRYPRIGLGVEGTLPIDTTPQPQREWVGLTDEEIQAILDNPEPFYDTMFWFARTIEAKLKEKNT